MKDYNWRERDFEDWWPEFWDDYWNDWALNMIELVWGKRAKLGELQTYNRQLQEMLQCYIADHGLTEKGHFPCECKLCQRARKMLDRKLLVRE